MGSQEITVAFSTHRPETLGVAERLMADHDTIILEEPPTPGFDRMLTGELSIEEYLLPVDVEYPNYSRAACRMLRRLYNKAKRILQVEPYVEILLGIHDYFADGGSPEQISSHSPQYPVYACEKDATGRLLDYYQTVLRGSFSATVDAVKLFARSDARRFALRDRLRVEALLPLLPDSGSVCIEAGEIHQAFWLELRQRLAGKARLRRRFLMEAVHQRMANRCYLFGPGDLLTLRYTFCAPKASRQEDLLAARSLIYSKILEKQEIVESLDAYPHTLNEIECIQTVNRLSYDDCRKLFSRIRLAGSDKARDIVDDYVRGMDSD